MVEPAVQQKADLILRHLYEFLPVVEIPLNHSNVLELLVATILSAQSTDAVVNRVTPELFRLYPTVEAYASAKVEEIAQIIKPVGLYNTKAKHIIKSAQALIEKHNGVVPDSMEALLQLPGVARKVASVVLWQWFGKNEGFTVDTHVLRLAKWFGLTQHSDPAKVEKDLMELFPQEKWGEISLRLVLLGRFTLTAKNPKYKGTVWEDLLVIDV